MSTFIEVGTCDFDTCEQLIKNGWNGIVIEPVKYYFDLLPKYGNIHYENIAITDSIGESEIHYLNPETIIKESNKWMKGISSLNSSTGPLSYEKNQFMKKNIIKQKVQTNTLTNLCEKYNINTIDFLKIDTEGHDMIVLQSLDLKKFPVKMIKIEHQHLDDSKLRKYLEDLDYLVYTEMDDIYAIK